MPLDYGSILQESRQVRGSAGVFDVSHMARFLCQGAGAQAELDHALGARMTDLEVGKARYSLLLAEDGGILDDLIVYRQAEESFLLVVNAANRKRDWETLLARIDPESLEDLTEDGGGILALQGPQARTILNRITGASDFCPSFLDLATLPLGTEGDLAIARTGYTGEAGFELFFAPGQGPALWNLLLEAGAFPAGLGARDVLRLEAALPLYGHEIHESVNPFEAGLRFGVRGWKERDFVGGDALRALPAPNRRLVGLASEKRVPREGYLLFQGNREVGVVCSGTFSPHLDHPIATAWLANDADGELEVDLRGKRLAVRQMELPFIAHRSRD